MPGVARGVLNKIEFEKNVRIQKKISIFNFNFVAGCNSWVLLELKEECNEWPAKFVFRDGAGVEVCEHNISLWLNKGLLKD